MKKILLFAAAAMVSLSSCVQTEEVYTGGVKEIGFKSGITRAPIEGTTFETPITVVAAWKNAGATDFVEYFAEPTKFEKDGTTWTGVPARYWPNAGTMQFVAYHPHGVGTFNEGTYNPLSGYTVTDIANETAQEDILFSDLLECAAPQASAQALLFHHALAQLKVTFKTDHQNVVMKSVTVKDVAFDGDLAVTAAATSTALWSDTTKKVGTFLGLADEEVSATALESTPLLIIPAAAQTALTIVYTFDGHEMTKVVPLTAYGDWKMGYKYIYNFTIKANEIEFNCTVDKWKPGTGADTTI